MLKAILVLDHAPDYRESFLRELGRDVDLTVIATPCRSAGLQPPADRSGYAYVELPAVELAGAYFQRGLGKVIRSGEWDVICVGINLRYLCRVSAFLASPNLWSRWIWWGHVFGRSRSRLLARVRRLLLIRSPGCLTYSEKGAERLERELGISGVSFNNTDILEAEFRPGQFGKHAGLKLLFVGRNQPRKKLQRAVDLARRRHDVWLRLIGPGMENLDLGSDSDARFRIEVFGHTVGKDLYDHFDWADLVVNPGHVGLLVTNAARHGKGIVIDSGSLHAPEHWLAEESNQPFIAFNDKTEVDHFIDAVLVDRELPCMWGRRLQEVARRKYTVEAMAATHEQVFRRVAMGTARAEGG